MKLRILDDSIRLRLDRQEVDRLGAGEVVACSTRFPSGTHLDYQLCPEGDAVAAEFEGGTLRVAVPKAELAAWAADESRVGIRESLSLGDGCLTVLIEKDFECLDPRPGESQANRFRNPREPGPDG